MKRKTKLAPVVVLVVLMSAVLIQAGTSLRPTTISAAIYSQLIGIARVDLKRDAYTMISIPLIVEDMHMNDTDDSVTCVGEMLAKGLYGGTAPQNSSNLYKYDQGTGGFDIIWLHSSGAWAEGAGLSTRVLSDTNGYWIFRTADAGADSEQAVIIGDVAVADAIPVTITEGFDGFNMICYPYPLAKLIDTTNFPGIADGAHGGSSPTNSDNIYLYDQSTLGFKIIWLHSSDVWAEGGGVTTSVVGVAKSFYYFRAAGQGSFTWNVERPYTLPKLW